MVQVGSEAIVPQHLLVPGRGVFLPRAFGEPGLPGRLGGAAVRHGHRALVAERGEAAGGIGIGAGGESRENGVDAGKRLHPALLLGEQRQAGDPPGLHEAFRSHRDPDAAPVPVPDLEPALLRREAPALGEGAAADKTCAAPAAAHVFAQQRVDHALADVDCIVLRLDAPIARAHGRISQRSALAACAMSAASRRASGPVPRSTPT